MNTSTHSLSPALHLTELHEGRVVRLRVDSPPAQALDYGLIEALHDTFGALASRPSLACVVMESAGPDFGTGFGLSHRRAPYVPVLLGAWHAALRRLASLDALLVAKVQGQCTGAAMEWALVCDAVICDPTARFALPEIALGAFSPVGALLLPDRVGRTRATDWLVTGRTIEPEEAQAAGLIAAFAGGWDDLDSMTARWVEQHVTSRSAVAVRALAGALHEPVREKLAGPLEALEARFLEQIAPSRDAEEGITAALRKRAPRWEHG